MTLLQIDRRVDARGMSCPMPIVETARAVKTMASGQFLEVVATDPGSTSDFAAWSKVTGHELVEQSQDDGVYRFVLRLK
ncbi:MAG: sulfurtransferase TusA family protein [Chloroflexota bacterium]|nr:MAG: sulfurtransferase TusA family protein [Chloroflexota bacterium]